MFPDQRDKDNVVMRTAFMLLLLLLALPAQAQMYKWVDANGRVQYSDTPPPGTNAQQIKNKVGVVSGPADSAAAGKSGDAGKTALPRTSAEQEQAFRKRHSDAEKAQKDQEQKLAETQQKEDNCRRARASVAGLQTGRQSKVNEKGERYYLDDGQIQQELAYAQNSVAQYCN